MKDSLPIEFVLFHLNRLTVTFSYRFIYLKKELTDLSQFLYSASSLTSL